MEFLEYDLEQLYQEVRTRAEAEGAYTRDAWRSVIDAVIEDHVEFGEVEDEDLEEIRENLLNRFQEFEAGERGERQ